MEKKKMKPTIIEYNCPKCRQRFMYQDGKERTECPACKQEWPCKTALHNKNKDQK